MFRKYGSLSYTKGSWVLHMLRSSLGPDLFRQVVKTYLERYRHGNVVTENLRSVIEEFSGKSHDRFFDQYVYHAHHPELKVDYSWDAKTKLAKLSVKQEQKVNENVMLFHLKLPVSFQCEGKAIIRSMSVSRASEDFYFSLPVVPEIVRVDSDLTLLAKITFAPPASMLHAQLLDLEDVVGRLLAVEQLAKKKDVGTVEKLNTALNEDPFYGVRMAASKALREIATEPAFEALIKAKEQDDARVRRQVIGDVGSFYKPEALAVLKEVLAGEKNPSIRSGAINGLAGHDDAEAGKLITRALASKSFRHQLGFAAVSAIRKQDDPAYLPSLRAALEKDEKKFTTNGFASGLRALGHLARNEEDKSSVRQFLVDRVGRLNRRVRIAAIDALGQLNDSRAIAVLEKFSASRKDTPERTAAEKAIDALRSGGKPNDDLKTLRKEVTDLKKDNQKLHQDLEDLKKRLDAAIGSETPSSDSGEKQK
jgi:aminopeptidase N